MKKLNLQTRNFTTSEVVHSDWDSFPEELLPIAYMAHGTMQILRDFIGLPLIGTSGYRSAGRNAAIGGAPNSYHIWRWEEGLPIFAVDLTCPKLTAQELYERLKVFNNSECYLHRKLNFVHFGVGKKEAKDWMV